jgi:hypothetical protein
VNLTYRLIVEAPDVIDDDTLAVIEEQAEEHDTDLEAKIERWLGHYMTLVESVANDLPDGWSIRVER